MPSQLTIRESAAYGADSASEPTAGLTAVSLASVRLAKEDTCQRQAGGHPPEMVEATKPSAWRCDDNGKQECCKRRTRRRGGG